MTDSSPTSANRVVASDEQGDDADAISSALRPRDLEEFVGQPELREQLGIALEAARRRDEPLEHVLLKGPPGLGKTTLSNIIAKSMRGNLVTTSGPALERTADLMGMLTGLQRGDVLFIDEIHRLPRPVEEYLYPAMEDGRVDFVLDKGPFARSVQINLEQFTLVGATTRAGMLSSPLRDRFGLLFDLEFYSSADLMLIVRRSAGLLGVRIEPEAAAEIGNRSRGTPRIANRLLRRVRDYAVVKDRVTVDRATVNDALAVAGVDARGLDRLDRRYLETLCDAYQGGPAGVQAIASSMQQEVETLEEMVEPFLLYAGFLLRTPQGRRASPKAFAHLQRAVAA
ncbi:MAG TPA: Holliday junction branch migration DNA helicase RuvB [Chloroflexota bacterium]|jgi:Holliday junction DNA helicase RuvB